MIKRIALSGDFFDQTGAPVFPMFDLNPLKERDDIELVIFESVGEIRADQLRGVDALILLQPKISTASLEGNHRLAMVARFGVGYDNVDVAACSAAHVAVVITPDGVRRPVAVSILTLMMALTGNLMIKNRLTREGPERFAQRIDHMGFGLVGRTLGSVGIGNIGAEMFRLARPLDMRFIAYDPYVDQKTAAELGVELVGLDDVFSRADVVAINCPLSEDTTRLVNAERLALMKPTAYLINTARGPIVDQAALTETLTARRIAGAGLDVLEQEPPDPDDPILKLDNVILTPHALCWTDQCFAGNGAADVQAVCDLIKGFVPRGIVNAAIVDDPVWREKLGS
ncbi:MAG TPA: NAD(P)-dependent oxidoreductase [Thermohalobaculum sp.]|nr:NAD(P)-dependent oxidoreductase [Thermohalobaculum sp.]